MTCVFPGQYSAGWRLDNWYLVGLVVHEGQADGQHQQSSNGKLPCHELAQTRPPRLSPQPTAPSSGSSNVQARREARPDVIRCCGLFNPYLLLTMQRFYWFGVGGFLEFMAEATTAGRISQIRCLVLG